MVHCMKSFSSHGYLMSVLLSMTLLCTSFAISDELNEKQSAVYNKIKFFSWLVNDSPTVDRIMKSSDSSAVDQLTVARGLLEQAQAGFDDGELLLADEKISAGLKQMTSVSRKIKDDDRVESARKKLFHEIKQHIESFSEAFERVAIEKNDKMVDAMLDRNKLKTIVQRADTLYQEGQLALANHTLKQAADIVDVALRDARHKDVLLHELSFDSIEDEYIYEIKRNESYLMLIKLLQDKKNVSEASRQFVNKIVSSNEKVVKEAEAHAAKGNKKSAIRILEKSTDDLSRALRMSGASF